MYLPLKALSIYIFSEKFATFIFKGSLDILSFFEGSSLGKPIVTDVQPRRIGYGGGAVTIHGQVKYSHNLEIKLIPFIQGFSKDVFSQFDPVLGNKVCIIRFCSKVLILH